MQATKKRKSAVVDVSGVKIGGGNPVVIQSMTSGFRSDQSNVKKIAQEEFKEALLLAESGSELIRIALNNNNAAKALPYIRQYLDESGFSHVPLVGCGQYEVHQILQQVPECLKYIAKLRINPGNIGFGLKRDKNFEDVISILADAQIPVRIGVNWGSLDQSLLQQIMDDNAKKSIPDSDKEVLQNALVNSALLSAKRAESIGMPSDKIIISCKVSNFSDLIVVYKRLANSNYALHLGLTEAGMGLDGVVKTATALGTLLSAGIGDTIRASLTQAPGEPRSKEVELCKSVLQSIGARNFAPQITSCPGCGRTSGTYFQTLTNQIKQYVAENTKAWKLQYKGMENLKVAVMGCVVNGPGESKHADIGISLPGYNEKKVAAVFIEGKLFKRLKDKDILKESKSIIKDYLNSKYSKSN